MKNAKKLLAMFLTIVMMASVMCVNTSAITFNWAEYKYDFQNFEVGTGKALQPNENYTLQLGSGDEKIDFTCGDWGGLEVFVENDPAGVEGNKVLKYKRQYSTTSLNGHTYYAYNQDMKTAFSFKYYVPSSDGAQITLGWRYNSGSVDVTLADFNDSSMTVFGNQLKYSDGTNTTYIKDKWNTCTIVIDDSVDGAGVWAEVYLNGEKVLNKIKVIDQNISSSSWQDYIFLYGGAGTVYFDDFESRRADWDILTNAPAVSVDAKHQGEAVLVSDKEIDLTFTAGTDNLMDTSTYAGNISVKAGATALTEGVDYTVSYADLKNVKLTLKNNMVYNTTYTVSASDAVKTVAGVSAPATFTFKTEENTSGNNTAPTATISGISDKTRFDVGEAVNFSVNAIDADGDAIKSVKIFDGENEIATKNEAPYGFSIQNLTEGEHTLKAIATDANDAQSVAAEVKVIVKNNTPTEVCFSVQDKYVFYFNENVTLSAYGKDADGEAISNASISVDGNAAVNGTFSGALTVGKHNVSAKVTDSRGNEYTKEITIEYRPEILRGHGSIINADFDTTDVAFLNTTGLNTGKAQVDEAHGNSFYLETTASTSAETGAAFYETDWSYWRNGVFSYDFYAEDVSAQEIGTPIATGGAFSFTPPVRIINGEIKNTQTGVKYGEIESGRWYHAELYVNTDANRAMLNIAGYQILFDNLQNDGNFTYVRAFRATPYFPVDDAPAGKKFYVDNIRDYIYGSKYAKIEGIKAVSESGKEFTCGSMLTDTKYFIVDLELPMPSNVDPKSYISFYKNGIAEGYSAEFYGEMGTNNGYSYYKAVKITPANPLTAGDKYSIKLAKETPGYPANDTIYSDSTTYSLCEYTFDFVACNKDLYFENAGVYEGERKVSKLSEIIGNDVTLNLNVTNITGGEKTLYVILAAYSGDRMLDIEMKTISVANDTSGYTVKTDAVSKVGADKIKGFIWDNNLTPFADVALVD